MNGRRAKQLRRKIAETGLAPGFERAVARRVKKLLRGRAVKKGGKGR